MSGAGWKEGHDGLRYANGSIGVHMACADSSAGELYQLDFGGIGDRVQILCMSVLR